MTKFRKKPTLRPLGNLARVRIAAVIEIDRVEIVVGEHAADAVGLPGSDRRNGVCKEPHVAGSLDLAGRCGLLA
jgi:hypothetical protein